MILIQGLVNKIELSTRNTATLRNFIKKNYTAGFASRAAIKVAKDERCIAVKEIK